MTLVEIEDLISESFIKTTDDYFQGLILNEEDFRACFYFHLRNESNGKLYIHLSKSYGDIYQKLFPDITILRNGKPLILMELKIEPFSYTAGMKDLKKLREWKKTGIKRGYFVHISDWAFDRDNRVPQWKNNYYFNLQCNTKNGDITLVKTKRGKKEKKLLSEGWE